jgi:acyl-CoA thioester hydrolase
MSAPRKRAAARTAATAPAAAVAPASPVDGATATGRLLARVPVPVRWGDLDAFNHVNNAAFLVYAQEARLEWLAAIDGSWFDENAMPVVAAARVNYRRQLAWPARIVVELAATRVGNSSVTITHRIVGGDDPGCLYADGEVVMVWIDPASGTSVPLPDAIRAACQSATESGATTSK